MVHLSESPDDPIAVARPPTSSRHEAAQTQKSWVSEHESQPQSFVEDAPQLVVDPGTVIGKRKPVVCEQREREDGLHGEGCMKRAKVDLSTNQSVQLLRGGPDYTEVAVKQLHEDFSYLEEQCIRTLFESLSSFYALTHLFLLNKQNEVLKRLNLKVVPPCPNLTKRNKGKGRALEDAEFDKERHWLLEVLANHERINKLIDAGDVDGSSQDKIDSDDGRMVECGCCFSECPAYDIATCPSKHTFCRGCITTHCTSQLLVEKTRIQCISMEGCDKAFSASVLRSVLSETQFSSWQRLEQRREVAEAGLVLEECPFCDFGCVVWDDSAPTFVCCNTDSCGKVTCRGCKKLDHLPKSCQGEKGTIFKHFPQGCAEVRDDEIREGRHTIAEAMTRALLRNCPSCDKPFIKEDGCNKITCPFCGTVSCYICRKAIVGYKHFDSRPPGRRGTRKSNGKCLLFDAEVDKHNDEVIQAAAVALEQVKQELPDVEQNVLRVEPPPAPRQIASPQRIRPILRPLFRPLPLVGGQLIPPPAPYMLGEQLPPAHILARMRNHLFAAPLMHDNAFPLPNELAGHRFDQLNINPVFLQARAMQAPLNLPGVPPLNHPMPVQNPPNLNMLPVPYLPLAQLPVQIGMPPMNLAAPHIPRAAAHAHEVVNPAQNLLHPVPPLVVPHQFVPPAVLPFSQHHLHCPRLFRDQGHQRQGGFLPYPLMAPPMQPQMPLPLSPQNGPGQDLQDFLPQAVQNHPILG